MSIWKYVVLLGGILGIAGFFAPFMEYKAPDGTLTGASAYEIARGEVDVSPLMKKAQELGLVTPAEAQRATKVLQQGVYAYRGAMIAVFIPAALIFLIGLFSFSRKKMGRLAGFIAILMGAACVGVWIFFFRAEPPTAQTIGQLGLGIYALFVCGLLGMLGGLGSLLLPDRTA
ncbi:MAG: hypothetical protein H0T42_21585 [Deltaproteobacteria bacterium]|nr:hypothetical protein [Deltaproteobacteria bacterium]